jgi:hypothetical protein
MALEYEQEEGSPEEGWTTVASPQKQQEGKSSAPASSINSSLPSESTRSSRASPFSRSNKNQKVVFSSPSYYHPFIWVIMALPLFLILIQMILTLVASRRREDFQTDQQAWLMGWSLILIFAIYMVVFPRKVDVRSNGSIGVKTFLITYQFSGVVRAYQAGMGRDDFLRPRLKFATAFGPPHLVVVRRRHGKWDVVVSPSDPEGFILALERVVSQREEGLDASNNSHSVRRIKEEGGGTKPDLSSTTVV